MLEGGALFGAIIGGIFAAPFAIALLVGLVKLIGFLVDKYRDWRDAPERERMEMERERAERRERGERVRAEQEVADPRNAMPRLYQNYNNPEYSARIIAGRDGVLTLMKAALSYETIPLNDLVRFQRLIEQPDARHTPEDQRFLQQITQEIRKYLCLSANGRLRNGCTVQDITVAQFREALDEGIKELRQSEREQAALRMNKALSRMNKALSNNMLGTTLKVLQEHQPQRMMREEQNEARSEIGQNNDSFLDMSLPLESIQASEARASEERPSIIRFDESSSERGSSVHEGLPMDSQGSGRNENLVNFDDSISLVRFSDTDDLDNRQVNLNLEPAMPNIQRRPESAILPRKKFLEVTTSQIKGERNVAPQTGSICVFC